MSLLDDFAMGFAELVAWPLPFVDALAGLEPICKCNDCQGLYDKNNSGFFTRCDIQCTQTNQGVMKDELSVDEHPELGPCRKQFPAVPLAAACLCAAPAQAVAPGLALASVIPMAAPVMAVPYGYDPQIAHVYQTVEPVNMLHAAPASMLFGSWVILIGASFTMPKWSSYVRVCFLEFIGPSGKRGPFAQAAATLARSDVGLHFIMTLGFLGAAFVLSVLGLI